MENLTKFEPSETSLGENEEGRSVRSAYAASVELGAKHGVRTQAPWDAVPQVQPDEV